MSNSTGNLAGIRQGSLDVTHTFLVNFNTAGISSGVKLGAITASAQNPVMVEVFLQVVTAFNATTTNVLTAGTTTAATQWLTAANTNELETGFYPAPSSTRLLSFTGRNLAGAITLTGAVKGEQVNGVTGLIGGIGGTIIANNGSAASLFETAITVADQIQQSSATDLTAKTYLAQLTGAGTANRFRLIADTNIYAKFTQSGTAATTGAAILIVREYSVNTMPIA